MLKTDRLIILRKNKGLIQKDMADLLQITRSAYVRYEKGHNQPPNDALAKLADFFTVSSDYLLGLTDDPTPPSAKKEASSVESTEEALRTIALNAFGPNPTQDQIDSLGLAVRIAIEHARKKREDISNRDS